MKCLYCTICLSYFVLCFTDKSTEQRDLIFLYGAPKIVWYNRKHNFAVSFMIPLGSC